MLTHTTIQDPQAAITLAQLQAYYQSYKEQADKLERCGMKQAALAVALIAEGYRKDFAALWAQIPKG